MLGSLIYNNASYSVKWSWKATGNYSCQIHEHTSLWIVVKLKYKVTENENTQVKYKNLKLARKYGSWVNALSPCQCCSFQHCPLGGANISSSALPPEASGLVVPALAPPGEALKFSTWPFLQIREKWPTKWINEWRTKLKNQGRLCCCRVDKSTSRSLEIIK